MFRSKKQKYLNKKGIALFLTLLTLAILSVIVFGLIAVSNTNARNLNYQMSSTKAYYLARAGIADVKSRLEANSSLDLTTPVTRTLGDGSYTLSAVKTDNGANTPLLWEITSVGTCNGTSRTLTAYLKQRTYDYAYFTDSEVSGGQTIWFSGTDCVTGPVHTNGYFSFADHPQFSNTVTSANKDDEYKFSSWTRTNLSNLRYRHRGSGSGNSSSNRYLRWDDVKGQYYYVQGSTTTYDPSYFYHYMSSYNDDYPKALNNSADFSFTGVVESVSLPEDVTVDADYTYNGETYITFLSDGTIQTKKGSNVETITPSGPTVIYVSSGNAIIEGGTVDGQITIAAKNDININASCVYKNKSEDSLGLMAGKNIVINTGKNEVGDVEVDALMIAFGKSDNSNTGSFTVSQYNTGSPRGTLTVYGGIIQRNRGPVGTFYSSTGQCASGYTKNYVWDPKLRTVQPPQIPIVMKDDSGCAIQIIWIKDNSSL